jgi:hypothetical protein
VVTQADRDAALYAALVRSKGAAKPTVRDLPATARHDYQMAALQASRARAKAEREGDGTLRATKANVDAILRDTMVMILATGAPGAEQAKSALALAFGMPGLGLNVQAKAKSGELRPRLLTPARLRAAKAVAGD